MIDPRPASPIIGITPPSRNGREAEDETIRFEQWLEQGRSGSTLPVKRDGPPSPDGAHPIPDQARIFNEDGFFGTAQAGVAAHGEVRARAVAVAPAVEVSDDAAPEPSFAVSADPPSGGPGQVFARGQVPEDSGTLLVRVTHPAPFGRASGAQPVVVPVEPQSEPWPVAEAEVAAAPSTASPWRGVRAQSTLRIAIRDIEQGLRVVVAAQALNERDRERLANEIAAVLSRHGLVPREVRVSGPLHARNSGKR